jgi:hypothetical protein
LFFERRKKSHKVRYPPSSDGRMANTPCVSLAEVSLVMISCLPRLARRMGYSPETDVHHRKLKLIVSREGQIPDLSAFFFI